jgi:TPR repeat protein
MMDFHELLQTAHAGNAEAQFSVAAAYRAGAGVDRSHEEALFWYRKAAERDHRGAQNDLGSMILNGLGTTADAVEATRWYRRAAESGDATAQFNLALRYLHGSGVEPSDEEAAQWLSESARQGHLEAISELGTMLRFGRGVERDFARAAELHVIAALDGEPVALGNLGDYVGEIDAEAMRGNALAALCLAKMHDKGLGVKRDTGLTLGWLEWCQSHCPRERDDDVIEVCDDMRAFLSTVASTEDVTRSHALVATLTARRTCTRPDTLTGPDNRG